MIVNVMRVTIPPMSNLGYGIGKTEDGRLVKFAGDHRAMRGLIETLEAANLADEVEIGAWIEPYQVVKEYSER